MFPTTSKCRLGMFTRKMDNLIPYGGYIELTSQNEPVSFRRIGIQ